MLDMSKAFDTVDRNELLNDLKTILKPDELHMMSILINDVILKVKLGEHTGEAIKTEIGIAQGDCLSAVLFTLYLARTMKPKSEETEHNYATKEPQILPKETQDHNYYSTAKNTHFEIEPKYADDISWLSTAKQRIDHVKATMPQKLLERNLHVNETKTEEFLITREGKEDWKECRFLGSLLDTEQDINKRKGIALGAFNTLGHIFKKNKNSLKIKLRTFNAYIASVFLYNSEIWTLTKTLEEKIDAFHRKLLRYTLNIHWPKTISNEKLYKKTKAEPWSKTIKRRRLNFLGHVMRLHPDTPARLALDEFVRPTKHPRGKPKQTWLENIKQDLHTADIDFDYKKHPNKSTERLAELTSDRENWRTTVRRVMSS